MKFILVLVAICLINTSVLSKKIINCYYGTWAIYRSGNGNFKTSDIDPNLCTHLSYSFFGITEQGTFKVLDEWLDLDTGLSNIRNTIALKQINTDLKVLAVVGGWNEGSSKYSSMAANANKRANFINSAVNFIQQYGFDGLDLDWEYPTQREGATSADRANFVTLLKELKAALAPRNLLLGIAVGAGEGIARPSYDIPNISLYVDFINVMTYDFATSWDGVLGFNAPLSGDGPNNVKAAIKFWLQEGAPPEKLILGIGLYGRTFQMANQQQTTPGSTSIGGGSPGPYTKESGYLGYNEICENINSWNVKWDAQREVPYAFKNDQWVSYDNVQSVSLKMDFLLLQNLGGAMVWSIETDDFRGVCGNKYPLLNTIKNAIGGSSGSIPDPSTTKATTTTTKSTTKSPNQGVENCNKDGWYINHDIAECKSFYQCVGGVRYNYEECQDNLSFDLTILACNWSELVNCV